MFYWCRSGLGKDSFDKEHNMSKHVKSYKKHLEISEEFRGTGDMCEKRLGDGATEIGV